MDHYTKARNNWRDALNLSKELKTPEEKELATKLPWDELCKASRQILYRAHHRSSSGFSYQSDEQMRRLLKLSPKI